MNERCLYDLYKENLCSKRSIILKMKLRQQCFLILLILWLNVCVYGRYYLYDNDCLDYYATDYSVFSGEKDLSKQDEHQIVPFCRDDITQDIQIRKNNPKIPSMTFEELNKLNITSLQLYSWSIHMDLIEDYEAFRQNQSHNKTTLSNLSIYNCSAVQKFGLYCQYSIDTKVRISAISMFNIVK